MDNQSMKHTRSEELFGRAKELIPGGVNSPVRAFRAVGGTPFFARSAKGAYLHDVDGNAYLDYVCTWGPAILGHAPECVQQALQAAVGKGTSFGVPGELEVTMAETVTRWVPGLERVRMCNSGTEATMSCIRLARGYTGRTKIIKFEGCYHGHVDSLLVKAGSGVLTLGRADSAGIPEALAAETLCLPFNDLPVLESVLQKTGHEVAALILEPVPANAGLILPQPGFLQALRRLADHYGFVLIFDEVMTGFRLSKGGVQQLCGVRPDLSAFGKVIGGGLPVGAFGGKREIMACLAPEGPVYQAGTLSGNPLAMAAGLAQLQEMERCHGYEKLEQTGALLESGVRELLQRKGLDYKFYRIGSMFCLFFTAQEVRNLEDTKSSDLEAFKRYFHALLDLGVYMPPSQFETCFISVAHGEREVEITLKAMDRALEA